MGILYMSSNYTERETDTLIDVYTKNPSLETVEKLMTLLNRPKKSIISKLVKEGVYVTRGYRTKTGELPVSKMVLVRTIEDALDTTFPDLEKAPKPTLKKLSDTVVELTEQFEEALIQVSDLSERNSVLEEMLKIKKSKVSESSDPIKILGG